MQVTPSSLIEALMFPCKTQAEFKLAFILLHSPIQRPIQNQTTNLAFVEFPRRFEIIVQPVAVAVALLAIMAEPSPNAKPVQVQKPEDCLTRTMQGTLFSVGFGSLLGALHSNWKDVSEQTTSGVRLAFQKTGGAMLKYGIFLGGVGCLYCSAECFAEKLREKEDFVNGFCGGLAAGIAVGMKTRSVGVGVGSGVAMGVMSTIVDATGHSLQGASLIPDDGTIQPRKTFSPTVRTD